MKIPQETEERIKRGRDRKDENAGERSLAIDFVRGDQYGSLAGANKTYNAGTGSVTATISKRNKHRIRQTRNHIKPIIREKVSQVTQQVPGYEVIPSTNDYDDITAAQLAEKIAIAGHDLWAVRDNVRNAVWYALVVGEGFVFPHWDNTVGPYIEDTDEMGMPNGETVGIGETKLRSFGGNEAFWEPGCRFEDSRWHAFEYARPIGDVMEDPRYVGPRNLRPDATTAPKSKKSEPAKMVNVTEYFERPCKKYPEGQWLTVANGEVILEPQPFPVRDQNGEVVDEPAYLHIAWDPDPDSDRDSGLGMQMVDPQRAVNDGESRIAEWIRLAMAPQILAARGSIQRQITATPGDIVEWDAVNGLAPPQWRETPPIPSELYQLIDRAKDDLRTFSSAEEISASSITSGSEAEQIINNQALAWGSFMHDVADMYAALMTRCLSLVQQYYTEERMMRFQGRQGWDAIADFKGADLRGQTDCRVNVASIEPRTRKSIEQQVMNIAQLFPGYFAPEVIISALKGGTAEKLIDTYQSDVRRVNSVIRKIKAGVLMQEPPRPTFPNEEFPNPDATPVTESQLDPMTGEPIQVPTGEFIDVGGNPVSEFLMEVPGWMPRPFDGIPVHKATLEDWLKSDDYEALDDSAKEEAHLYYSALLDLESRAAQRAAEMQQQQASENGMAAATRPQQTVNGSLPALPS